jgi:hypothetical protein
MKKMILILFLGIFLVSCVGFVIATNNGTGNASCHSNNLNLCSNETACNNVNGFWYNGVCNEEEQDEENGTVQVSQSKYREAKRISFYPWQKRNDSECLEGCKCVGAVVSCITETGKTMTIEAGRSGNVITITIDKNRANTSLELEQEQTEQNKTKLRVKLSNGRNAEVKIMPDVASERALERLRLKVCSEANNCSIELKEVGQGNQTRAAYEIQAERHAKLLAMFRLKMQVKTQIDAETGEVISVKKPWWAFLATEPEE